jgi:hypothetical protein
MVLRPFFHAQCGSPGSKGGELKGSVFKELPCGQHSFLEDQAWQEVGMVWGLTPFCFPRP